MPRGAPARDDAKDGSSLRAHSEAAQHSFERFPPPERFSTLLAEFANKADG
jgi:hypothetical protein